MFNPFVGQPVPPRHSHAAGPAALRSPPAGPRRSGGGRGSGYSCAACGRGGEGGDGGSKTEWKSGGRRGASPGGVCVPGPGLPGAGLRPARGLRCTLRGPDPALGARAPRPRRPAARVGPAAPASLSADEPVVVAATAQDVPAGNWEASPAGSGSQRPTKMWKMIPIP